MLSTSYTEDTYDSITAVKVGKAGKSTDGLTMTGGYQKRALLGRNMEKLEFSERTCVPRKNNRDLATLCLADRVVVIVVAGRHGG
jgi:hypothetical protein